MGKTNAFVVASLSLRNVLLVNGSWLNSNGNLSTRESRFKSENLF